MRRVKFVEFFIPNKKYYIHNYLIKIFKKQTIEQFLIIILQKCILLYFFLYLYPIYFYVNNFNNVKSI